MISADDITAFAEANNEALSAADRIIDRVEKSAIQNRLFYANEELMVVRALRAQRQIIAWLIEAIDGYQNDERRRFDESVGCYSETGERTS